MFSHSFRTFSRPLLAEKHWCSSRKCKRFQFCAAHTERGNGKDNRLAGKITAEKVYTFDDIGSNQKSGNYTHPQKLPRQVQASPTEKDGIMNFIRLANVQKKNKFLYVK